MKFFNESSMMYSNPARAGPPCMRMAKKSSAERRVCGPRGLNRDGDRQLRRFPQLPDPQCRLRRDKSGRRGHTRTRMESSDHDLMARTSQGDGRAFRILAERHAGRAHSLARRILGNEALAE